MTSLSPGTVGDLEFRQVVEEYQGMVYGIALSRVGSKFDADDVFQDVFLIYYSKNKEYRNEEHRRAWLIKTTLNCCKRFLHSSWRKKTTTLNEFTNSPDNTYQFASQEENEIFTALRELPEKYRIVLHLFYFEEFSAGEIAEALGIASPTVRMRLKRGRDMMREKLKGEYNL